MSFSQPEQWTFNRASENVDFYVCCMAQQRLRPSWSYFFSFCPKNVLFKPIKAEYVRSFHFLLHSFSECADTEQSLQHSFEMAGFEPRTSLSWAQAANHKTTITIVSTRWVIKKLLFPTGCGNGSWPASTPPQAGPCPAPGSSFRSSWSRWDTKLPWKNFSIAVRLEYFSC